MSIKPLRFSELSDELADAVGLYDAAAMDLDEIDTTILDQTLIAHVGGGGEDLMTAGGIAEEVGTCTSYASAGYDVHLFEQGAHRTARELSGRRDHGHRH